MKKLLYIIFFLASAFVMQAQAQVAARIDTASILIGAQAHLCVSVSAPAQAKVSFPEYKSGQQIGKGVEVVESHTDTLSNDDSGLKVERKYTITAWDSGKYVIPALSVKINGKANSTQPLTLNVKTISLGKGENSLRPMHDVADNPFSWQEWLPLYALSILALLLIAVVCFLYIRLKQNKPVINRVKIVKKQLPHEKALQTIASIKAEQLDKSEDQKAYYTKLTDALRLYLQERFGINAMEMTSQEILGRLQKEENQDKMNELREVFETADLVKFAKYATLNNEKDLYLTSVVNFIDSTKQTDKPNVERVEPALSANEQSTMRRRTKLKVGIIVLSIAATALLVYVVWTAYGILS